MFDEAKSGGSSWGVVIFFLILFWAFLGGNGFGGRGYSNVNSRETAADAKSLFDLECMTGKSFAVLNGNLETAFREVINVNNVNTARVLDGQKDLYIKQLERENTKLYIDGKHDQTLYAMQANNAELNRRLDGIECSMLKRPPVYPTVCVPCSQNSCGGCGTFA